MAHHHQLLVMSANIVRLHSGLTKHAQAASVLLQVADA